MVALSSFSYQRLKADQISEEEFQRSLKREQAGPSWISSEPRSAERREGPAKKEQEFHEKWKTVCV